MFSQDFICEIGPPFSKTFGASEELIEPSTMLKCGQKSHSQKLFIIKKKFEKKKFSNLKFFFLAKKIYKITYFWLQKGVRCCPIMIIHPWNCFFLKVGHFLGGKKKIDFFGIFYAKSGYYLCFFFFAKNLQRKWAIFGGAAKTWSEPS